MSYIVLARRYRPQTFDEVLGQDHITGLLKNAIKSGRIAHAYLFCGPRGIGKTSCARILAKSLNCKNGPTTAPCGQCPACREITQTTSFDVIEIDGASNRGIDEIRTLRENVKFAPSYGRFKIYIVDEVHMLTQEAFNALLKTLEEPPEHVKFVFATTAPNKVPSTIISRCQRFDFKRISIDILTSRVSEIAKKEKFKIGRDALFAVAKAASGSMRDALSIVDQLSAVNQRDIKADDVYTMLGMIETDYLFELSDCLAQKDCAGALCVFDTVINKGKDIKQFNRDIIEHFRNLMVISVGGKSLSKLVEYPVATKERILVQSQQFSLKEILEAIEVFVDAQETARVMDSPRIPLEVAFAKLTYKPQSMTTPIANETDTSKNSQRTDTAQSKADKPSPKHVLANQKGHLDFSVDAEDDVKEDLTLNNVPESMASTDELTLDRVQDIWDTATHAISRKKMSVATYLQEGSPYAVNGSKLIIGFPPTAVFHKETLEEKHNLKLIEEVFAQYLRRDVIIRLKVVDDHKPQQEGPLVQSALKTFKGKVVNKWHDD